MTRPYKHGQRWRIVIVGSDNRRWVPSFATEAEAKRAVHAAQEHAEGRTVSVAVEQYVRSLTVPLGNRSPAPLVSIAC